MKHLTCSEIRQKMSYMDAEQLRTAIGQLTDDDRKSVKALVKSAERRIELAERQNAKNNELLEFDREFYCKGAVAGVDEVGRGCLAGPVVACAMVLMPDACLLGVDDSKRLTFAERARLFWEIREKSTQYAIGKVDPQIIDEKNIRNATFLAMRDAIAQLGAIDFILVDGCPIDNMDIPQKAVISGDSKSLVIAAASIVAKVTRDEMMIRFAKEYPQYGFERNMGYGTAEHIAAIKRFGPTPIHRKSFLGNLFK